MTSPSWLGPGRTQPDVLRGMLEVALRRYRNAIFDMQVQAEELGNVRLNSANDAGMHHARNVMADLQISIAELIGAFRAVEDLRKRFDNLLRERSQP